MLISQVSDGEGRRVGNNADEYQTADELFELMAKDHNYNTSDNQPLSARDLIILYKNIDVGTKLMSNANVQQRKTSNQHVETVIYKDHRESDDSDVSEIYSNEDLQDVFSINNERIDLINNLSSLRHPLCHKCCDIEIQPPNASTEYDNHFLFKDPYIKEQLNNINILADSTGFDTMLPASLLDYICCKRLEDNYNFYMDNIIRYVQNTIEQLKRISNGDYLTDKARAKWKEVDNDLIIPRSDAAKVLGTSVSIPMHVMGKVDVHRSTWDDIVHSEVDVRTLSKILEKKIIIEIPRLICGTYKLFSEGYGDNLIISCKQDLQPDIDKRESRVDVVFKIKSSISGHVIKNINSIMILQKTPSLLTGASIEDHQNRELAFKNYNANFEEHPKIVEIDEKDHKEEFKPMKIIENNTLYFDIQESTSDTNESSYPINNYTSSNQECNIDKRKLGTKMCMKTLKTETDITFMSPDELRCAIRRLNMQTPVPEESEESTSLINKKKSTTKVRIKSPYENKSYFIEEKKRKKLLEIREKREKKKMALSENCRITKHKYGKSAVVTAQSSSSVTKLSITNKSFYNSIYGDSGSYEGGVCKKSKPLKKDMHEQDLIKIQCENELPKCFQSVLERNALDDGNTETLIGSQQKLSTEIYPISVSAMSNCNTEVNLLTHLIGSSGTYFSSDEDSSRVVETKRHESNVKEVHEGNSNTDVVDYQSSYVIVPANTPKEKEPSSKIQEEIKTGTTPVECRKSIDKIYNLLKKLGKHHDGEITNSPTQYVSNDTDDLIIHAHHSSTTQISDSGTSAKHHISTNPSTFSFEKNSNSSKHMSKQKKKREVPPPVAPRTTINTKLQTSKVDSNYNKSDRKRVVISPGPKTADNPLKTISQILQEFNNVQKTRLKAQKNTDHILADGKTVSRQGSSKKPRQEQSNRDACSAPLKSLSYKERRSRPGQPPEPAQFSHQITYVDDKQTSRTVRKLSDIIDEAKEARGEAVRGPPKPYSRLNTLAQPKKAYVQAHNEEHQNKHAKNMTVNRLQKQISAPLVEKNIGNLNYTRNKRKVLETASVSSAKPGTTAVSPLAEKITRPRRSTSNSPTRKSVPQTIEPSFKQISAPKSPDMKKKMVAVESYVKSHYGHMPIDSSELKGHEVHKSRVPLIPNDIELASLTSSPTAEESTTLGKQLHYMVDTMINTNVPVLSVLTEYKESSSKLSEGLEKLSTDSLSRVDEPKSESDYLVDIFKDKTILTAVASIPKDKIKEDKVVRENVFTHNVQPFNSATELRKLENALYQQMSVGAFPKRLRIKNLTLTPKQSLQQVIVVQSGDAGSLLVKSCLSQSLKIDSKSDSKNELKPLATLSNTHINWGFNIPLQVATIGYAFPTYESTRRDMLSPRVQTFMKNLSNAEVNKDTCKSHKTSQCFKGIHKESCLEQATQANIVIAIPSTSKINVDTWNEQKEINKKEFEVTKNGEKVQPSIEMYKKGQQNTEKTEREQPITEECKRARPMTASYRKISTATENCKSLQRMTENLNTKNIITIRSNMSINNAIDPSEDQALRKPSETIDHSTSLDILMGLLNEIRKITGEPVNKKINNEPEDNCKELEILLNNTAARESSIDNNCRDIVSLSSFEKFNQLDSIHSIRSLNKIKDHGNPTVNNDIIQNIKDRSIEFNKPKSENKEVTVDIGKQYVNNFTNPPSTFLTVTVNHSTDVTDSIIDILSEPLKRSVDSVTKYKTINNSSIDDALKQRKVESANEICSVDNKTDSKHSSHSIYDNQQVETIHQTANVQAQAMEIMCNSCNANKIISKPNLTVCSNLDPLLKIKRDMLVTVYSILVFTVFAALSFPKIFFQIEM